MNRELTYGLDARYYVDPAVFEAERRGLLASTWQFAAHASELENPGDYVTYEVAGERLFSIRANDGCIHSYYNVCRHRAHELLTGQGCTRVIICPYHAWTYNLTGELRGGPNLEHAQGLDLSSIRLTEVRTEVFLGFVFVNLDPHAEPMDKWYPAARAELEEWVPHHGALRPLEWVDVEEQCNWKVSVENYSECYHCTRNHRTFATGIIKPETYDVQPQGYCLRHTTECQNLDQMMYDIDTGMPHSHEYSSWFLWPAFSFQVYPGNLLNTYHWRPGAVDRVQVWRGWYSPGGADSEPIRRLAAQDRATTVEEDIYLVESVQRGLSSRAYSAGPLVIDARGGVNSEHSIDALQRWVREAIDGEPGGEPRSASANPA